MTAEEIARYNESLLCVPGEAARLRDLTRLRGRDVRWGVSVRHTSLRAKPTDALCPTRAGDRYDDALQLTAVLPNEPMALLGESADGRFCRVETSYFAGWVAGGGHRAVPGFGSMADGAGGRFPARDRQPRHALLRSL